MIVGINWKWQLLDSTSIKALLGEMTDRTPTDRGKLVETKRHLLTYGQDIPLYIIVTAANTHNMKAAINTLDNIVVKRLSSKINKN